MKPGIGSGRTICKTSTRKSSPRKKPLRKKPVKASVELERKPQAGKKKNFVNGPDDWWVNRPQSGLAASVQELEPEGQPAAKWSKRLLDMEFWLQLQPAAE